MPITKVITPTKDTPDVRMSTDKIEGLFIIELKEFGDERGSFKETFNEKEFIEKGIINPKQPFIQDNMSRSVRGVLRGLHMQRNPFSQSKLVSVIEGCVWDIAVDVRPGSKTYGKWVAVKLSRENNRAFYIPREFLHGFIVVSETAIFAYKCDNPYHPASEVSVRYDDPQININWEEISGIIAKEIITSEKDAKAILLKDLYQKTR